MGNYAGVEVCSSPGYQSDQEALHIWTWVEWQLPLGLAQCGLASTASVPLYTKCWESPGRVPQSCMPLLLAQAAPLTAIQIPAGCITKSRSPGLNCLKCWKLLCGHHRPLGGPGVPELVFALFHTAGLQKSPWQVLRGGLKVFLAPTLASEGLLYYPEDKRGVHLPLEVTAWALQGCGDHSHLCQCCSPRPWPLYPSNSPTHSPGTVLGAYWSSRASKWLRAD